MPGRYFEEEQKRLENQLPQSFKDELVLEQKKKRIK
ncbi:hypothetical protein IIS_05185 [Bacillus cereus VD131]|nr:hypothetical protein IIS_05185 [Bacillus cereus VD131]MCS3599237.1 hypothetical protein [Bacillus sp. JUb91]